MNKTFENSWRKAHNMKETDFLLFFGGILGYAQDIEVILKTAKLVSDNKDIKFIIYGNMTRKRKTCGNEKPVRIRKCILL